VYFQAASRFRGREYPGVTQKDVDRSSSPPSRWVARTLALVGLRLGDGGVRNRPCESRAH